MIKRYFINEVWFAIVNELSIDRDEIREFQSSLLYCSPKIDSFSLEKKPQLLEIVTGIRRQYLIFDNQYLINTRGYSRSEISRFA